jgi:hypothetical protein
MKESFKVVVSLMSDAFVRKSLKDMYAKCGSIHNVHKLSSRMPK